VRTLVIVDDHAPYRATARGALEASGWHVLAEAADADQALAAVRRHRPSVVLVDLDLRGSDSLTLAHALADEPSPPAVVLISGWDEADVSATIGTCPVAGFLSKSALSGSALERVLGL
jgi:DNA-binding NarL/FixJ family response regulator